VWYIAEKYIFAIELMPQGVVKKYTEIALNFEAIFFKSVRKSVNNLIKNR